ncbi:MAG: PD-(D/E)XK nuclease family protein, partial [Prevotella sp.]|nr:PD-(D/E)XK nuclease family protein [Prevotella sp.]
MENTFIKYVANDILEKYGTNLSDITVVFPNKRAALFLNQAFADISDKPIWSPSYITINELLHSMSDYVIPDEIKLTCELYHSYVEITKSNETLDEFYGWGQLLLSDFDDIDKNMADARMIFNNVANLHEFDSIDYLSDEQKETLKQFFSQFTDDHNSKLRERFLRLWNCLYDVYVD